MKGHSLHWECGLKLNRDWISAFPFESLPSLGVWIETNCAWWNIPALCVTPFIGSVD